MEAIWHAAKLPPLIKKHQFMKHPSSNHLKIRTARSYSLYTRILFGAFLSAFAFCECGAAVSIGVEYWLLSDPDRPAPSNADLVNAGSPDLLYFNSTSFSNPLGIFDGQSAWTGGAAATSSWIAQDEDEYPATITFTFDTIENPLGYNISSIRTLTHDAFFNLGTIDGWVQYYKLEYSVVGTVGFETLVTVDVGERGHHEGMIWVTLLDIDDELTGVDALKFTLMDPSEDIDSITWIGEIDIMGSPVTQVPEPASTVLLLGATALLLRRTRSR
jgi:hypothetical protein